MKKNWWKLMVVAVLFVLPIVLGGCLNAGNTKPQAFISASVTSGEAPLTVQLTGASDQTVDSFQWTFGDGTTGHGKTVTHTYKSAGDYLVTLVASKTGCYGTSMSEPAKVTIRVLPVRLPQVKLIHISPLPACKNQPISFWAEIVDGPAVTWSWWTSDGQSSSAASPTFTFSDTGRKVIWVQAADEKGRWSEKSQTVLYVEDCCQPCPPRPCPSCGYLERLEPQKACVLIGTAFRIEVLLNGWPCEGNNPCGIKSDPKGIVPIPDPGCTSCKANIAWAFYLNGKEAWVDGDYQVLGLDGQMNQAITAVFLKPGEWSVKATLTYPGGGVETVWGYYTAKAP